MTTNGHADGVSSGRAVETRLFINNEVNSHHVTTRSKLIY
jgi:hypothetical protein